MKIKFSEWSISAIGFSIIVAMFGYIGFSFWAGWTEITNAINKIGIIGTFIVLMLSAVNYGLRFIRWQIYLAKLGHPVNWRPSLRIYLSGFALTTTPGKAGEAFRGILLKKYHIPHSKSFAAFISERLSDLIAILIFSFFGLIYYSGAIPLAILGTLITIMSIGLIRSQSVLQTVSTWALKRRSKIRGFINNIVVMLYETQKCYTIRLIALTTSISLIAWGAEALAFHWALEWLGNEIPLVVAVFIYATSMLAGAASMLPGGLGSSETVMISLLVFFGLEVSTAVAATVFIRLTTLWFAVIIGLIAMWNCSKSGINTNAET
ncbi:MAG: flippase-like domain-containing protein [Gammaproteobacteria bacterium]|nr:flippase-like domain-containing protein [Gammaproteobacteria bacterium]